MYTYFILLIGNWQPTGRLQGQRCCEVKKWLKFVASSVGRAAGSYSTPSEFNSLNYHLIKLLTGDGRQDTVLEFSSSSDPLVQESYDLSFVMNTEGKCTLAREMVANGPCTNELQWKHVKFCLTADTVVPTGALIQKVTHKLNNSDIVPT